jgi:hypothetical protein
VEIKLTHYPRQFGTALNANSTKGAVNPNARAVSEARLSFDTPLRPLVGSPRSRDLPVG